MEDITFGGPHMPMYHDLPDFVFEHPEVKDLISTRGIDFISPKIQALKELDGITLSMCHIGDESLENICLVESLTFLFLEMPNITRIPASISKLTRLEELTIFQSPLHTISTEIGTLSKLKSLELHWNDLQRVPAELFDLPALEDMSLRINQIHELPSNSLYTSPVKEIDLQSNCLTALPRAFGNLSALKTLFIGGNKLAEIPVAIQRLKLLETLSLSSNVIKAIPHHILELPRLKELRLEGNELEALPGFCAERLSYLNIQYNSIATLPRFKMPLLERLALDAPAFFNTPIDNFTQLSHLQHLSLNIPKPGLTPSQQIILDDFQLTCPNVEIDCRIR